jgi:hypothetical protein
MPDRYLRAGLWRSDRFDQLGTDAQLFFVRLLSVVDDFGCFDGRDGVIASACYPIQRREEPLALAELQLAQLLIRYTNGGKPYIALLRWGEPNRYRRQCPAPPINVDRPGIKYAGKWGHDIGWANPPGTEPVSVLLDQHGKPTMPQPQEWRRPGDWAPPDAPPPRADRLPGGGWQRQRAAARAAKEAALDAQAANSALPAPSTPKSDQSHVTETSNTRPVTGRGPRPVTSHSMQSLKATSDREVVPIIPREQGLQSPVVIANASTSPMSEKPPTTPTATRPLSEEKNGVRLVNGEWQGLSEAQRLRWQEAWPQLSIPDELDHIAFYLVAHPDRLAECEKHDDYQGYIVRWLLREAKPTVRSRGATDA